MKKWDIYRNAQLWKRELEEICREIKTRVMAQENANDKIVEKYQFSMLGWLLHVSLYFQSKLLLVLKKID